MSLAGFFSNAVNMAVDALSKTRGVVVVVAAGNFGVNACQYSPASAPTALVVAASDNQDRRLQFPASNTGPCVDIEAPGYIIKSAYIGPANATAYMR